MLLLQLNDVNIEYIYFGNPLKNNIIQNGWFRHINYSTHYFSLNTIYINIPFASKRDTETFITQIKQIEKDILELNDKIKVYNIKQCLDDIKDKDVLLKISGLWETNTHCGLSFKFIRLQ